MDTDVARSEGSGTQEPTASRYRWYVLAILTLVATLNGIDKHIVPALAEPIKAEFQLSDTQFGLVAGLIYSVGFAAGGIPLTLVVDRVSRTRLLAFLLTVWSGATAVCSMVTSFAQLAVARFIVGAAEVGGQPISMALIADWFRIDRRGTALGIWTISRSISLMLSFSAGGYIAVHWGWRWAFLLAGIPGILLSAVILLSLRDVGAEFRTAAPKHGAVSMAIARAFVRNKALLLLAIAMVIGVGCQNGVMAFMSSFLTRTYGLGVDQAGVVGGFILGVGAGFGMPLGGILTDFIGKRSIRRQYVVVAMLMFLAAPAAWVGLLGASWTVAAAGLFVFELLVSCAYTAGLSTYLSAVPADKRGSLTAILTILVIFVGAGLGPPVAGFASDTLATLRGGLIATTSLIVVAGVLVTIAVLRYGNELSREAAPGSNE